MEPIAKMADIQKLLENDFWADSSDDEGIGSDESLDFSDQSVSDGGGDTINKTVTQISLQNEKHSKSGVCVKKIGSILKRSVKAKTDTSIICSIEPRKVFGVDLIEHLEQSSSIVPEILKFCSETIEKGGVTDGVYRLSGQGAYIARLKQIFQEGNLPCEEDGEDIHSVASLLKVSMIRIMMSTVINI